MSDLFPIIHEDETLLVINKPAGLVCHPTKGDVFSSLISRLRLYLGAHAEIHLINRLDRETSGVTLIGKELSMANELRKQWPSDAVIKEYHTIVNGHPGADSGTIEAALGRDAASEVAIKDCVRPDGAPARTDYWVLSRFQRAQGPFSLLKVRLHTGRKHQIRIHLAHIGHPIVGDKLYAGDERIYLDFVHDRLSREQKARLILPWQALHSAKISINSDEYNFQFNAEPEPWFQQFVYEVP